MSALDALLGTISKDGVELELGSGLNFEGAVTVVRNAATGKIDITITGGGGGGGHTIEDNGTPLVQRTSLNFIGFTVSDVGGKSTVQLPAIGTAGLANGAVTGVKLVPGTLRGQQLVWDGATWYLRAPKTGTALGNASVTLQFATACAYFWPTATNTTAIRTLTLGTSGLAAGPNAGVGAELTIEFDRALSHDVLVANSGPGGGVPFLLPAGTAPVTVTFYFDGTNWALAGWKYTETPVAA